MCQIILPMIERPVSIYYSSSPCTDEYCLEEYLLWSGDIYSPNFPMNYSSDTKVCLVHIMAPPNAEVKIVFDVFNVEYHETCFYDAVEVIIYPYTLPKWRDLNGENISYTNMFIWIYLNSRELFNKHCFSSVIYNRCFYYSFASTTRHVKFMCWGPTKGWKGWWKLSISEILTGWSDENQNNY